MSSNPLVVLGLCACLFLGISGTAYATKMKNPDVKKENTRKSVEFLNLVEGILLEHPAILSAQADIDMAKARVTGSEKPLYNPELEIEAENAEVSTYTLGITQTLDWYDKRSTRYDEAELVLEAAKAKLLSVKEQVAAELMAVVVRYLGGRDMHVVGKSRVELITQFVKLIKSRQVVGDIGESEADMAQLTLAEAIIQHAEVSSDLIKAFGDFKALTGVSVDPSMPFPSDLPTSVSNNIDIETLATQHPLVVATQLEVQVAKARIRVTKQERHADPSIGITTGTEDDNTLVALRFSIPVQVRNDFSSDVVASRHAVVKDEQQAQNIYRQVLGRIEASKSRYVVMSHAWKLWSQSGQKTLIHHLENLKKLWETGEISTTQYLVQFQKTLDIQLSGEKLKGDVWHAWIEWLDATGSTTKWLESLK